jgi:hypothetical protein
MKLRPTVNIQDNCGGWDVTILRISKYGVRGEWKLNGRESPHEQEQYGTKVLLGLPDPRYLLASNELYQDAGIRLYLLKYLDIEGQHHVPHQK